MKTLKVFFSLIVFSFLITSCEVEGINDQPESIVDQNSGVNDNIFDVSTDNSGTVKITPIGQGFTKAQVDFGHGTGAASSAVVNAGNSVSHVYPEGDYEVSITYYDIAGNTTTTKYPLSVKFSAPADLKIGTDVQGLNVTVTPEALNAKGGYTVKFGENDALPAVVIKDGESASYTYSEPGVYTISVTALSGGVATASATTEVTIFAPFSLPVTFEDPIMNYGIGGTFGNVGAEVIDNPFKSGINTSEKVWKFSKPEGAESWGGTWTPLGAPGGVPVNIDNGSKFKIMVYATEAGKDLHFQLEDGNGFNPGVDVTIPVANQWVELTFDFASLGIAPGKEFGQYVVQYNLSANGTGEVIYIDNITQIK